jgi:RNA-directed DNA polymerase
MGRIVYGKLRKEKKGERFADLWRRILRRRGQKGAVTWERMTVLHAGWWLPQPRITHPWPEKRFAVKHSRREPGAGIPPAGICAGSTR